VVWGIRNFWNVVSNAAFVIAGAVAVRSLRWLKSWERTAYLIFLVGVFATAFGSSYYHLDPNDGTLFWDRLPMTVVFMSLLAMTVGKRAALWPLILCGMCSVVYWRMTGDLSAYILVQFVPMMVIPFVGGMRWTWGMIGFYGVAKLLELFDGQIGRFVATGGHPWKHVAAAVAILCFAASRRPASIH